MNDNLCPEQSSLIEMIADGEHFTIHHSRDIDGDFIGIAAKLMRDNKALHSIQLRDLTGGTILAYRGDGPSANTPAL